MKQLSDIQKKMLALLEEQGEASAAEFKGLMPGLPEQTVFSRIRALERKGLIYEAGRGLYATGAKPVYRVVASPKMLELNSLLVSEFVGASLCISSLDGNNIIIETDRKECNPMLVFLRSRYPGVFSLKEAIAFREKLKDAIVVKALVSDAPQIVSDGMSAPSLEKTLVDLVADRAFFRLDDDALHKEYQRAFEVYPVRKDRMLRYAGRRGVAEEVEDQIAGINLERVATISIIQQTLRKQPVLRAWLFGSWSRQEERVDSDIDLLVSFDETQDVSLLDYTKYMLELQDNTGKKIDYVENGYLLPFAEESANKEKYIIYERTYKRPTEIGTYHKGY